VKTVRKIRWAGNVSRIRETKNAYKISAGEPEGKKILRRPVHR
jgi:hypothetical protein